MLSDWGNPTYRRQVAFGDGNHNGAPSRPSVSKRLPSLRHDSVLSRYYQHHLRSDVAIKMVRCYSMCSVT